MRKLYEQDIIEVLYGATLLGAGGGGSLKQGLGMLDGLKKDGNKIEVDLLDLDEIGDNEYAAVVCGLGSPVAMLDPNKPAFGPDAVHAFKAFQKAFIAEGKEVKYLQSGEMGGFPRKVSICLTAFALRFYLFLLKPASSRYSGCSFTYGSWSPQMV